MRSSASMHSQIKQSEQVDTRDSEIVNSGHSRVKLRQWAAILRRYLLARSSTEHTFYCSFWAYFLKIYSSMLLIFLCHAIKNDAITTRLLLAALLIDYSLLYFQHSRWFCRLISAQIHRDVAVSDHHAEIARNFYLKTEPSREHAGGLAAWVGQHTAKRQRKCTR